MYIYNPIKMFLIVVPVLGLILILLNVILSSSNSYNEKTGPFECGFTSFAQSRTPFSVAFILVAILFLPFDLEISSILPYVVSLYNIQAYGLIILILFILLLVSGFVYEINTGALHINRIYKHKINSLNKKLYN